MIQINDNDLPITVAEKIITGQKSEESKNIIEKKFGVYQNPDMFTLEEIREIAEYLLMYVKNNKKGN